ncbi:hypothetical protein ISCGN_010156 [Ixodes scapularis]
MFASLRSGGLRDSHRAHRTSTTETRGGPDAIPTECNSSKCSIIAAQVNPGCNAAAPTPQPGGKSAGALPSPVQPATALQARLPSPIPSMTSSLRAPDQLSSDVHDSRRRSRPYHLRATTVQDSDRDSESSSSHVAPKDDKLKTIWLEAIGRSCSDKRVQVCSRRFAPEAFEIRTGLIERPQLRRGAVLTLFLPSATAASAASSVYKRHNSELLEGLQGKTVDLAGDGHCDPPAFCAKHWTYSFHEASTKKVIHIEQVRVGEVRFTNQNKKPTLRHTPLYLE